MEVLVTAIVGMIGIRPVIEAIRCGKDIAFANKETLVTAGHIIMPMIRKYQVLLTPVDSEHAAIFQCLNGEHHGEIAKILLTAWQEEGGTCQCDGRGCTETSELDYGEKDYD